MLTGSVTEYVNGVNKVVAGVKQYTDGTTQLSDGVASYVAGEKQLAAGAEQLQPLADGLTEVNSAIATLNAALDGKDENDILAGANNSPKADQFERAAAEHRCTEPSDDGRRYDQHRFYPDLRDRGTLRGSEHHNRRICQQHDDKR